MPKTRSRGGARLKAKPVREKPLELSEDEWYQISNGMFLALEDHLPLAQAVIDKIGFHGEHAYRLGVKSHGKK